MVALAIFVALAILAFPRDGRWFIRLQTRDDGVKQHYWQHAGGWELVGIGLLVALFLASVGGDG